MPGKYQLIIKCKINHKQYLFNIKRLVFLRISEEILSFKLIFSISIYSNKLNALGEDE